MKITEKIFGLFRGSRKPRGGPSLALRVRCARCGEGIEARIDLNHDLTLEYGEGGGEDAYFCRKVLIGSRGCYAPVEVLLKFDARRRVKEKQIIGGAFLE